MKVLLIDILLTLIRFIRFDFRGLRILLKWTPRGWIPTRIYGLSHGDRIWSEELQCEYMVVGVPSPNYIYGRWQVKTLTVGEWEECVVEKVDPTTLDAATTPRNP